MYNRRKVIVPPELTHTDSVISVNWNLFLTLTVRKIDAKNVTKSNEIEFCDRVPRFV